MTAKAAKSANQKAKTNTPGGMDWQALATIGDVRRMLRFCILEVKRGRMNTRKANCMGFLGSQLIACIETEELEKRIAELEAGRGDHQGSVLNISVSR